MLVGVFGVFIVVVVVISIIIIIIIIIIITFQKKFTAWFGLVMRQNPKP